MNKDRILNKIRGIIREQVAAAPTVNTGSTPSAAGNVHIYRHDNKLKVCGGSGIQFEEGGFTRWHITNGALHAHFCIVFARLLIDDNDEGVHAFLVPIRDKSLNIKELI